eukprot:423518-Amphidinium_carterae.1
MASDFNGSVRLLQQPYRGFGRYQVLFVWHSRYVLVQVVAALGKDRMNWRQRSETSDLRSNPHLEFVARDAV